MQTLKRERRQKFEVILSAFSDKLSRAEIESTAELLADAAESRSEKKTDEPQGEYNVELMRGDWREYPEHLWKYAENLRDVWMFRLPAKPQKKSEKGQYKMWCMMLEELKEACGEFGADVLTKVHTDWRAGFKGGIAPYTVAQPSSLSNMARSKARELRDGLSMSITASPTTYDSNGLPESW